MKNWKRPKYNNSEQILKRRCCDLITLKGGLATMYPGHRGVMRAGKLVAYRSPYMPPGVADIIACIEGEYHEIEVKRPDGDQLPLLKGEVKRQRRGVLSHHQKLRQEKVFRTGGRYHVVRSTEEVKKLIDEVKLRTTENGDEE